MQVIVYSTGAVGCAVVQPLGGTDLNDEAKRVVPQGSAFLIVDSETLPTVAPPETWLIINGAVTADAAAVITVLSAYAARRQAAIASGGFSFNVAPSGQPAQVVKADTDVNGRINLSGLNQLAAQDQSFTTTWVQQPVPIPLDAAQIQALALAVGTFYNATFVALSRVLAQISNGTITTTQQIDSFAWPATSG